MFQSSPEQVTVLTSAARLLEQLIAVQIVTTQQALKRCVSPIL
jgi:hypothetical protein